MITKHTTALDRKKTEGTTSTERRADTKISDYRTKCSTLTEYEIKSREHDASLKLCAAVRLSLQSALLETHC